MTTSTAGAAGTSRPASASRRSNTKRKRTLAKRREAAALTHRVIQASLVNPELATPTTPPSERMFVRKDVLEPAQIHAMLASCSSQSRMGIQDRALIAVAYWGCARQCEAADLKLEDVSPDGTTLTIRGRSGARQIKMPEEAAELLRAWREKRRRLHKPLVHVGLFCIVSPGERPAPATRNNLGSMLRRPAKAAKITKPVSFTALRNARAKELALAGAELPVLAELLDHWKLKRTRVAGKGRYVPDGEIWFAPDLNKTRHLVSQLAPGAECVGQYSEYWSSPIWDPEFARGREPGNKGLKLPAEVLTPDEIRAILRQIRRDTTSGIRNRAIIIMLWRCGLRLQEALDLEPKNLDLQIGTVTVMHGKGDKRRTVGMDPRACEDIAKWLERREKALGLDPSRGKLFTVINMPHRGGPLHQSWVRTMLADRARHAGITKRVHPHGLRHTHAFELSQEGVPLPIIQKQLGHVDLATTARYIDHLAPFEVIRAMQAREWAFSRG